MCANRYSWLECFKDHLFRICRWAVPQRAGLCCPQPAPCAVNAENRQLDYGLGNWKIGIAGSSSDAHSTVRLLLDKCLVVENWEGGRGHSGQNSLGYSADDRSWYGMFADNEGRVHVFTSGKVSAGSAEFTGTAEGRKLRRY